MFSKSPVRLLSFVLLTLFSVSSWAFKVSPMVQSFTPSGKDATQNFVIENTGEKILAVKISAKLRGFDKTGKELREDTKDLTIYPPQFTVDPGKKRLVRVSYVGENKLEKESAYRLIVQQLPVEFKDGKQKISSETVNINFLLRYLASIYITPPEVHAKIEVEDLKISANEISFTLHNSGGAHQVLSRAQLALREKDKETPFLKVPEEAIEKNLGAENLLAGMKKKYTLKVRNKLDPKKSWILDIKTDKAL